MNFCARSLQILFIWPNNTTGAISCNSMSATFFACVLALVNFHLLQGAFLFDFLRAITCNVNYLAYDAPIAILRNSETPTLFTRALALVNLLLLPGALLFKFSCAIASNIIYLAS